MTPLAAPPDPFPREWTRAELRMPYERAPRVPLIRGPRCYGGHPRVVLRCTRAYGHGGRHAAAIFDANIVVAVWEQT